VAFGNLDLKQPLAPGETGAGEAWAACGRDRGGGRREPTRELVIGRVMRALAERHPQAGIPADAVMLQHLAQAGVVDIDEARGRFAEPGHRRVVVDVRQAHLPLGTGEHLGQPLDLHMRHPRLNDVAIDRIPPLGQRQVEARAGVPEQLRNPLAAHRVEARHGEEAGEVGIELHGRDRPVSGGDRVGDPGDGECRPEVEEKPQPFLDPPHATLELSRELLGNLFCELVMTEEGRLAAGAQLAQERALRGIQLAPPTSAHPG
jgi:hypothetical protein